MNFGFTDDESLLERRSVVDAVQDVEERTGCIFDIDNVDTDLQVEAIRFRC